MIKKTKLMIMFLALFLLLPFVSSRAATPVRNTDVDVPAEGNTFMMIRGKYSILSKDAILAQINAIRKEACEEGLVNPSTGEKLTLSDFHPIKWSSDLEWIAQTRAAEATLVRSHFRPNNTLCFDCTHNEESSWAENLAWNWDGIMMGINQWYSEKTAWVAQDNSQITGHYTSLINPDYSHIALGCFQLEVGGWYTVSAEFSSFTGLAEEQIGVSGLYDQMVEVPINMKEVFEKQLADMIDELSGKKISKITLTGISNKISSGMSIQLTATVSPKNAKNKKLKWSSDNTEVATVSQNGKVTIKKGTGGKSVTITATATDGSGVSATFKIKVMKGTVKKITIKGAKKTLKVGKTMKLKAIVKTTKGNPVNKKLMWTSSNTKYATVFSSGKVKALKTGKGKKVKITAMATDGTGKKKVVTIKIK